MTNPETMEHKPPIDVPPFQKKPMTIGIVNEAAKPEMANMTISWRNAGGFIASTITTALIAIVEM